MRDNGKTVSSLIDIEIQKMKYIFCCDKKAIPNRFKHKIYYIVIENGIGII